MLPPSPPLPLPLPPIPPTHPLFVQPLPSTFDPSTLPSPTLSSSSPPSSASPVDRALLIRRTLIKRLDSLSDALCLSTLQLFISLLSTRDPLVFDCLIPRSAAPSTPPATFPKDPVVPSPLEDGLGAAPPSPSSSALLFSPALFEGLDDPHSHPDYADALLDAQGEAPLWTTAFADAPLSASASPSYPAADAGMFVTTLVHKLDSFLEHSMAVNLRLSLVVALLFHCPAPRIRRLLAAPSSAASSASSPSVMSALAGLWKAGKRRQLRLPSSVARVAACKQRMAQLATQAQQAGAASGGVVGGVASAYPVGVAAAESLDVETFLQAWLVLEGTVLEVSAISDNAQQLRRLEVAAKAATAAAQSKGSDK